MNKYYCLIIQTAAAFDASGKTPGFVVQTGSQAGMQAALATYTALGLADQKFQSTSTGYSAGVSVVYAATAPVNNAAVVGHSDGFQVSA